MRTAIQDEFTSLPISPQLKSYRRKVRDGVCVSCGRKRGEKLIYCTECREMRNQKRRKKGKQGNQP